MNMKWIDLTLPTPEENLAFDEALLDMCEEGYPHQILRFWEPADYFVVLGYSNKIRKEVHLPYCRSEGIQVLRRISGGGTVLQGPGCLNYTLVLDCERTRELKSITASNTYIMEKNRSAIGRLAAKPVTVEGHTDLACELLKFSGNAQRRKKKFLLFHGSFLLDFNLSMIEKTLPVPERKPDYRGNRAHTEFLMNMKLDAARVRKALCDTWEAIERLEAPPLKRVEPLVKSCYALASWREKF